MDSIQLFQECYQTTKITGKTKSLQQLCNLKANSQQVALVTTGCLNRKRIIPVEGIISVEL